MVARLPMETIDDFVHDLNSAEIPAIFSETLSSGGKYFIEHSLIQAKVNI
jgi:hypothetical protein